MPEAGDAGMLIAVVDSGVQPSHPHIIGERIEPGVTIGSDGAIVPSVPATQDRLGHGTAVTAAIQERAPAATIIPVRIFGTELRASAAALVAAIDWATANGADFINLSLGTTNLAHRDAFAAAADRAREAGAVLVAARSAQGVPCLPGTLPGVIAVELDWDCPRETWRADSHTANLFHAAGYPRPIPGVPLQRNLHGISFAVAAMTGFAARLAPAQRAERLASLVSRLQAPAPVC